MREREIDDVPVFLGGIVPTDDVSKMKEEGIAAVFGPGTSLEHIVTAIREAVANREAGAGG
jgi:methylmalonyl-CoA mutase C-terminal domain/subunit